MGVRIRAPRVKKFLRGLGKKDLGERDHRLRLGRIDLPLELAAHGVDRRKFFTDAANHRAGGVVHGYAGLSLSLWDRDQRRNEGSFAVHLKDRDGSLARSTLIGVHSTLSTLAGAHPDLLTSNADRSPFLGN